MESEYKGLVAGMPFCLKCGRELSYEAKFCPSCGASVTATSKKPHIERKTLLGVLLIDLVVVSGLLFYLSQPQVPTPIVTSSPTPTSRLPGQSPQTPTPTPPSPSPAPTSTTPPTEGEESSIRGTLRTYFDALNRHTVDDAVGYFTDEVEILINHGRDYSYKGPREGVKQYLLMAFMLAPDAKITEVNFNSIDIGENRARVQVSYLVSSKSYDLSRTVAERVELVKQNNVWKIAKTDIVY
jgi:hypothetical protein